MISFESLFQNEYLIFSIAIIITLVIMGVCLIILKKISNKIAGKKKSLSKYLFRKLGLPIFLVILMGGFYFSLQSLSIFQNYYKQLSDIFFVIITILIATVISRIINISFGTYLKIKKGLERSPHLISSFFSIIIYLFALLIILGYFQLDVTPLLAGVGVGALAIGLALQSTLSNFFAGMHLISDRPIDVGDYIEIDENTKGTIEDIGWRSTRIRTLADNLLIIPNGKLAESNITNFSKPKQDMSLWVPCGVAYDSDLKKVEKVTLEVAKSIQQTTDGAVKDFEPGFRFKEFGDSNIDFITILRVSDPMKRFAVRNEFIIALKERFDKERIEISWPIRKIYNVK